MKILVLSPKPPWPPHDGGAVAIMRCIEGLTACGASVTVLTMRTEKHGREVTVPETIPSYIDRYESVNVDTRVNPFKALANLIFSNEPYDLRRFISDDYSDALQSILTANNFNLIHCEGLLFSYFTDKIRSLTGSPVTLRAHNLEHRIREMMADNEKNILKRMYLRNLAARIRRVEMQASRKFDAIVPISEPDSQWFRAASPELPVMLCETGAPVPETTTEGTETNLKAGFIGALNWQPNITGLSWFVAKVWPIVLNAKPDVTFHIAGRGVSPGTVRHLKQKNIVFEGEVTDAARFTSSMTVMIAPLFAGSGLRIKIIEAMSLGKPVVATAVAAEGIPAGNRREIFICDDERDFSDAIVSLLDDPVQRETTGQAAKELVKTRFDNRKQTAALFEFYKNLTHDR